MNKHLFQLVRSWAAGEILTDTSPADRHALKIFVAKYDELEAKLAIVVEALKNECVCAAIKRSGPGYRNVLCEPCEALEKINATGAKGSECLCWDTNFRNCPLHLNGDAIAAKVSDP